MKKLAFLLVAVIALNFCANAQVADFTSCEAMKNYSVKIMPEETGGIMINYTTEGSEVVAQVILGERCRLIIRKYQDLLSKGKRLLSGTEEKKGTYEFFYVEDILYGKNVSSKTSISTEEISKLMTQYFPNHLRIPFGKDKYEFTLTEESLGFTFEKN